MYYVDDVPVGEVQTAISGVHLGTPATHLGV